MHSKIDAAPTYPFHQNRYNKPNDIPYLSSLRQIEALDRGSITSFLKAVTLREGRKQSNIMRPNS